MTLNFPNPSRSYDGTRCLVRFWGYDNAMEKSFLIDRDILVRLQPGMPRDEASLLRAFDVNRDLIHAAAAKACKRGGDGFHQLTAADFGLGRT